MINFMRSATLILLPSLSPDTLFKMTSASSTVIVSPMLHKYRVKVARFTIPKNVIARFISWLGSCIHLATFREILLPINGLECLISQSLLVVIRIVKTTICIVFKQNFIHTPSSSINNLSCDFLNVAERRT